jgi:uncharacterized protein
MVPNEARDPERLCRACGLCCDGTLFDHVSVKPQEVSALKACGMALEPGQEGFWNLRHPCSAWDETMCRIYAVRPSACRNFECLLLRAHAEGEVTLSEALDVVSRARAQPAGEKDTREAFLRRHFLGQGNLRG